MTTKMIGDEPKSSAKTATRKNERYPMVRKLFREMYSFAALYQLVKCDRVAVGCEKPFKEAAIVFTKAAKSNPELDTLLRTFATCKDRLAASLAAEVERYAREDRQAQPQQLQQQQQEHPGATTRACPRGVLYALLEQARSAKRIEFHTLDVMDGGDCMTVQMADGTTASLDEAVLVTVGEEKREEKRARRNVASMFVPRVIAKMMHYAYLLPKLDTIAFDDKVVKEWTAASLPAYAQGNVFPGTFLSDNKKAVDKLWGRWKRAFLFLRKNVPKW